MLVSTIHSLVLITTSGALCQLPFEWLSPFAKNKTGDYLSAESSADRFLRKMFQIATPHDNLSAMKMPQM